jgi:heme a synthase
MVIIGGITRLTGSGLSITEWKPIMGAVPPMNDQEWQASFEKYKQIPQFQKINYDFTLGDFKSIFWWEYLHRLIGRLIGVVFIIPFLWFYFRGMLDRPTIRKTLFLFALGGLQGVIGWLMVKSGLTERTSVSHIRLAIHLITAFITFGFTFYFALQIIYPERKIVFNKTLQRQVNLILALVIIQIIYGAFVAGMHAGKMYNTFPLMNGQIIPDGVTALKPTWLNLFDNPVMVQFIHRFLAGMITIFSILFFLKARKTELSGMQNRGIALLLSALSVQLLLGIFTLLTSVEITLAVLHQVGAFFLFSVCVFLYFIFEKNRAVIS